MPDPFDDYDVDTAIQFIVDNWNVGGRGHVDYSAAFKAAGMTPPQDLYLLGIGSEVTTFMKTLHDRCIERDLPSLDSVVVNAGGPRTGVPGGSYFKINGWPDPMAETTSPEVVVVSTTAWRDQQEQVRAWMDAR